MPKRVGGVGTKKDGNDRELRRTLMHVETSVKYKLCSNTILALVQKQGANSTRLEDTPKPIPIADYMLITRAWKTRRNRCRSHRTKAGSLNVP